MPTLYFSPGACSLSPLIALHEAGLAFEAVRVDLKAKQTARGEDYTKINPKGYVPALVLDDGEVLTEGPAIVQYVADKVPEKQLAPPAASHERYKLQEWLNYITAEVHKSIAVLFSPAPEEYKETVRQRLTKRFELVETTLQKQSYLLGAHFTVADGYLFWTLRAWQHLTGRSLTPSIAAWFERVAAREGVTAALTTEATK
jgi:glutathione S-transferase